MDGEDVAEAVAFLVRPEADYITGAVLESGRLASSPIGLPPEKSDSSVGTMGHRGAQSPARRLRGTVHNRTRSKESSGRRVAQREGRRPRRPHKRCRRDERFGYPDVEQVLFGSDGISQTVRPGTVVVDMSTISPDKTRAFSERLATQQVGYVDAPVSGGSEGAEKGTLTIMAGGEAEHVERARPVLDALGAKVTHVGPVGSGQLTKAVNQIIIGGYFLALAEGLTFGMKAGLDMDKVIEAISQGMCRSAVMTCAAGMLNDDYPLGFNSRVHLKDLESPTQLPRNLV